jgi:hypothetical protein
VDLPMQRVLFILQVRSCCERCASSLSPRILYLCHGASCNTNFSEFHGKYLQESLENLTAALMKFQVLWGVKPCCLTKSCRFFVGSKCLRRLSI